MTWPDLSHYRYVQHADEFIAAKPALFAAKATQGLTFVDPLFNAHKLIALNNGFPLVAYHFGDKSSWSGQVDHFLKIVPPQTGIIPCLDFEHDNIVGDMSILQAETWVKAIESAWGRWPWVYGRSRFLGQNSDVLGNCPYWGPQYNSVGLTVPDIWTESDVWAWQYYGSPLYPRPVDPETHEIYPDEFPGVTGTDNDMNVLLKTIEAVREYAGFQPPPPPPEDDMFNETDRALLIQARDNSIPMQRLAVKLRAMGHPIPEVKPGEPWADALAQVLANHIGLPKEDVNPIADEKNRSNEL